MAKKEKTKETEVNPVKTFVRKKVVSRPFMVVKDNEEKVFKFLSPIKEAMYNGATAKIVEVEDLNTGKIGMITVGSNLGEILGNEYPDDGYVGKGFAITKTRLDGARRKEYNVEEVEI